MGDTRLGGRPRTRINAQVRARHALCPMCGFAIDQTLNRQGRRHPLSSVIDEWIPRDPCGNKPTRCRHGCTPVPPGDVSLANCVESHSACNAIKHNHWPVTDELRAACRRQVEALMNDGPVLRPI